MSKLFFAKLTHIRPFSIEDYILFDCPGQVELFTHHSSLRNIFFQIQRLGYRVCITPFKNPIAHLPEPAELELIIIILLNA